MAERAERAKICVVTTPGEITCIGGNRYEDPRSISAGLEEIADIDVIRFDDSKSGIGELTEEVARVIHPFLNSYNGFVVTGGKFNLQYIASRLAFTFGPNLNRTIAVTGANLNVEEDPFKAAGDLNRATMAAALSFNEAVVSFEDLIVRGNSCQLRNVYPGWIDYIPYRRREGYRHLGKFRPWGIEINHQRENTPTGKVNFLPDFESDIVVFGVAPGTEPESIEQIAFQRKGLVLTLEGGLALPARDPYSFYPLVDNLSWANIPVLVVSPVTGEKIPDDVRYEKLGGIALSGIDPMVAVTKFSWVLKRVEDELGAGKLQPRDKIARVKEWMEAPYVGEFGIGQPFNTIQPR